MDIPTSTLHATEKGRPERKRGEGRIWKVIGRDEKRRKEGEYRD